MEYYFLPGKLRWKKILYECINFPPRFVDRTKILEQIFCPMRRIGDCKYATRWMSPPPSRLVSPAPVNRTRKWGKKCAPLRFGPNFTVLIRFYCENARGDEETIDIYKMRYDLLHTTNPAAAVSMKAWRFMNERNKPHYCSRDKMKQNSLGDTQKFN